MEDLDNMLCTYYTCIYKVNYVLILLDIFCIATIVKTNNTCR